MNWGKAIDERRKSRGLTQAELLRLIKNSDPDGTGITKGYLSELISGNKTNPHTPALQKIAAGFGVKFSTLAKEAEQL